ncbi:hypothetical protein HRbin41_01075 [bacterium HR41]|nr:hypothetical protein HRbin41_01075 [bacterium HR41]
MPARPPARTVASALGSSPEATTQAMPAPVTISAAATFDRMPPEPTALPLSPIV